MPNETKLSRASSVRKWQPIEINLAANRLAYGVAAGLG